MIEGAITFQTEACEEVMTKIEKVAFSLELDQVLSSETMKQIK